MNVLKEYHIRKPTQCNWSFRRDNMQFLVDHLQLLPITLDENQT